MGNSILFLKQIMELRLLRLFYFSRWKALAFDTEVVERVLCTFLELKDLIPLKPHQ